MTEKTLLILDEVDYWLFDSKVKVPKAPYQIGFSATKYKFDGSTEAEYLKELNVNVVSGQLNTANLEDDLLYYDTPEDWLLNSMRKVHKTRCGFLIYCKQNEAASIRELLLARGIEEVYLNCKDPTIIDSVEKRALIVTEEYHLLMRGTNFRSRFPIHFLIATPLPNQRGYWQALGRVGRFTDEGTRSILSSCDKWNAREAAKAAGDLDSLTTALRKEKLAQKKKNAKKA